MKKLIVILFVFMGMWGYSQNLVPNPSFEDTVACPDAISQIYNAESWDRAKGSPDYFNSCSTSSNYYNVSVPNNSFGHQYSYSGNAYAGFYTYPSYNPNNQNEREWIICPLVNALTIGEKYYINFKVSLADSINCATNNIGILFSTTSMYFSVFAPLNNFAHINNNMIVQDTMNWVTIDGSFIADSAYNYMIIGNFFDISFTDTIFYPSRPVMNNMDSTKCYSYYYLDDISLVLDTSNIIREVKSTEAISIYPNPTSSTITIQAPTNIQNIKLYNLQGTLLYDGIENEIDLSGEAKGIYVVKVTTDRGVVVEKVILE